MKKTKCTLLFLFNRHKISPQPYYTENLGIQYIGGVLRNAGFDVKIINADYNNMDNEQIVNLIHENNTNLLGINPCYSNMEDAVNIAQKIKSKGSNINICLGGHHATFCCDEILKNEDVFDFIIRGEGEETSLELAKTIEKNYKNEIPLDTLLKIKGLSFHYDKKVIHNETRDIIEKLDEIPFPVRDPLDETLKKDEHAMPLLCTSRGCPANCSFCSTPRFYGRIWRARSAKNIVDEIQYIIEKYGFTQFYVTDDQFAGKGNQGKNHIQNVIREIKARKLHENYNLHFFIMVRADFFRKENENVIKQFPEVGFMDIFIGFESGDSKLVKIYSKGSTQEQYQEAINILKKYNIFVEGGFIIFNPYSTFSSLKNDANLIKSLRVPLFSYYTKELLAYPGTKLFDKILEDNMFIQHTYKKIKYRYKEYKIEKLYGYLSDFFASFEETDNQLFEVVDFQIKLRRCVTKIRDDVLRNNSILFIEKSDNVFQEITDLNYTFFNDVLDIFECDGNLCQCELIEQEFKYEYSNLFESIYDDYLALNKNVNIIKRPISTGVP